MSKRATSQSNTTTTIQNLAQAGGSAEILRLRKELIQAKSSLTDLQEELDEKTNLYLDAIKQRDQFKERLNNASENIKRVQDIVEQKVAAALQDKIREHQALEVKNKQLEEKERLKDQTIEQLTNDKKILLDKVSGLNEDLAFYSRNADARDSIRRIDALRQEKEINAKKVTELMNEINTLSGQMENFIAENRALRQMANVPDNFGIKLDQIKLYDKEKIEDFKKLIKVLQDDNYKLEQERAKLKHQLKLQSMMYKQSEPSDRYKNLSQDQLLTLDQFVLRLLSGDSSDPADAYALRRENESLKAQMEALNSKGFEVITNQVKLMFKDKQFGDNSQQLSKLIADNEELRIMIAKLFEQGVSIGGTIPIGGVNNPGASLGFQQNKRDPRYRPPVPGAPFEGEYQNGTSLKFDNSSLNVVDKDGRPGVTSSTAYEHAFLQLQLQECFELIKRKDDNLKFQQVEIDGLYKRVRSYVLTQDQLYKDFVRMERAFNKKEQDLKGQLRTVQDQVLEEQSRVQKCEALLKSMSGGPDAHSSRLIELTKQNSILDVNLLRLSRKYQILEEQEKLLRREYHAKDNDTSEKDLHVQWRINSLKEWKAKAIQQLKFQHEKLRIAVPMSEYDIVSKELELSKQRTNDQIMKNAKLANEKSDLQKKLRNNMEAELNLKAMKESKEQALEEYEIIKKRLEQFDPVFRFENSVFQKIAQVIMRAGISPEQAFAEFDKSKDGNLSRAEFVRALEMMKVINLSQSEIDCVWDSLDVDKSGSIDYREFARKLEHYGVRNRSREEIIITQMINAVQRSNLKNISNLFDLIDKTGRGFIDRQDFSDIFYSLNLKIDQAELERFMDNFWKDKEAGIDYQGFLRIFKKYQINMDRENKIGKAPIVVSDETIRLKKQLYMQMKDAFDKTGKTLGELFRMIDTDHSHNINSEELFKMFKNMKFQLTARQSQEIFDSIDFDGGSNISLPELISDFKMVCERDVEELIRDEHQKRNENKKVSQNGYGNMSAQQYEGIQAQTRLDMMQAEKKQLQRKLDTQMKILKNSEQSLAFMQQQYTQIEKQLSDMTVTNYEYKDNIVQLKKAAEQSINKDMADNLAVDNEKMKVELVETRAAMLSYKNMYNVIADQARNLKLSSERKKDEHDNLMNALREMQSEGVTQERLGKLYFIIMLSRWQEATVNKKYDAVLTEVKELRGALINSEQMCLAKQSEHLEAESLLQKYNVDKEKLKQQVASIKGAQTNANQIFELNQRIQNMGENLTESEEALMQLRTKYREAQDLLDSSQAKAEHAQDMLQKLQYSRPDQLSDKLVELSEKHQTIRLNELRANRKCEELEQKGKYLSALLKGKNDQIAILEEKASKAEAYALKIEEQFRKRDNERIQFFSKTTNRFDDGYQTDQGNSAGFAGKLERAGTMSYTNLHQNISQQDINQSHKSSDLTAGWTKPQIAQDNASRISRLEAELQEARSVIAQKVAVIQRFEQWQIGDKYLSQDEVLKDAISEHRAKTSSANEKEHKEMADAAYQTIKTLQDMLDNKNGAIRSKEDQITKLRQQMNQQREIDAQTIAELREQISITGNETLQKMHEIVSKNDVSQKVVGQRHTANNAKFDNQSLQELQRQLHDKDNLIQQLRARAEGHGSENALLAKKRDERLDEIAHLKAELQREKSRNDVAIFNKKLERLQKERKDQDETIKSLNKAIDAFKIRMTSYESEKLSLKDENEQVKAKEKVQETVQIEENKILKQKITFLEQSRDSRNTQLTSLKVKVAELEGVEKTLKDSLNDIKTKYDTALKALEDERRAKGKTQAELNEYKQEQKIGGNVGGAMSYEKLLQKYKELEQDNKILECQKKTVVVYNKEAGSFEYIGEARPLDYNTEITSVREILNRIQSWLSTQHRLTVGPIFRALDKNNHGDLKPELIAQGFEKIGIVLKDGEMKLLKQHLDIKNCGYLKIEPLIRELQGIRTEEFIILPMKKLARLVESRDFNRQKFREIIDPKHEENLSLDNLQRSLQQLNASDFAISSDEIEQIFKYVANVQRLALDIKMQVTKLIDQLFEAVKAVIIEKIRDQLKRSGKYLIDLLVKHDSDKDASLTYTEFENLLLDLPLSFKNGVFNEILIGEMLDVGKRQSKISFDILKWYIGTGIQGQSAQDSTLDMQPGRERQIADATVRGKLSVSQFEICRGAARKIFNSNVQLVEILNVKDQTKEGILSNEEIIQSIVDKRIPDLQPSEINLLVSYCDRSERGFLVILTFASKVTELAQETAQESALRKFALSVNRQGINLRTELTSFETQHSGRLDRQSFKRAMKNMPLGLSDAEIDVLFSCSEISQDLMDTKEFVNKVAIAYKSKAPIAPKNAVKPESKVQSKIGAQGTKQGDGQNSAAFDSWEIEKKYKKNLEALKQEIEDRNREIQVSKKEVKDSNERYQKLESDFRKLEARLVDRNAKPPKQMNSESEFQNSLSEIQQLKDQIYHMQTVNQALNKTVQVDLKAEMVKISKEKELLEQKLKMANEKVRSKTIEVNQLIGKPMDQLVRREEREEFRQKQIDELTKENAEINELHQQTLEKLFKAEERLLDLKFEKETFDLQYARLQKRITDLENYKLQSSQLQAVMKNQYQSEIDKIREDTEKLRGDALNRQPGDSVKLRPLKSKTAAELETVVEQLKRVVEKQRLENEALKKENDRLESLTAKKSQEPALQEKVKRLEARVLSYELADVKTGEKDTTIKKLVFANKTLREDLEQEIERFNLLQAKFKDLLIKYNIATKENTKNQKSLFTMTTGAQMDKYQHFLDDQGEFNPKKSRMTEDPGDATEELGDDLNDSLNQINRADARGYGHSY